MNYYICNVLINILFKIMDEVMNNILIVPDYHGNINRLYLIEEFLDKYPESNKWIAIEYVLHNLEFALNKWLINITKDDDITEDICRMFCRVFIYGKKRNVSEPCSKLYAPNIDYTRKMLQTLKKFEYIICLEMSPRPSIYNKYNTTDNQYWIELIKNKTNFNIPGVIIVGAMHANVMFMLLEQMEIYHKCNFYTILRNCIENKNQILPYNSDMIQNIDTIMDIYVPLWSYNSIKMHYK